MSKSLKNNRITRFLIISFVGLMIFSILVFAVLSVSMSKKSADAVYKVGNMYMEGIGEQLSNHFQTAIDMRFKQVEGIVEVVPQDSKISKTELYKELKYRAEVRKFEYLALCTSKGEFETVYGEKFNPLRPKPFLDALKKGEKRVVIGKDANDKEIILFGISANYPMSNGEKSIGIVVAVPIDYINNSLSLKSDSSLVYCHIIRMDGTFVIDSLKRNVPDYFSCVRSQYKKVDSDSAEKYLSDLSNSLKNRKSFSSTIIMKNTQQQIYGIPMPFSEWYLLMVMPYGSLDNVLNTLDVERTTMTLVSCGIVLILLLLIFYKYYKLNGQQVKELKNARSKAVKATKAKSEFLSNMSHDIRTPMNAIVGMTAVAAANIDNKNRVKECLEKIDISSKHLLGLINDILDMSKIESGKMDLFLHQASLKEIFDETLSIIQPQTEDKNQNLVTSIDNSIADNVICDSVRLKQVLLNLLSNAVKFTPEKGIINLSLVEMPSPKGNEFVRVVFKIKDNGIGMSDDFVKKIYQPYFRADSTRVHQTEGAGLGMAITKYILDAMKGEIKIESELDKGTEFIIKLDFEKLNNDFNLSEKNTSFYSLKGKRVLIAEDNEINWEVAKELLSGLDIIAEWAQNGQKCIEMLENSPEDYYSAVLMDLRMPVMNGYEATKNIRELESSRLRNIPIIAMTADAFAEDIEKCSKVGMNGHISKPIDISKLGKILLKLIKK